eukprot:PITA_02043
MKELQEPNEDGVSILFYLQKIYPDEWKNFLQRVFGTEDQVLRAHEKHLEDEVLRSQENELRHWASYRGQTLTRTVRGMMYYRKALELQSFLDMAKREEMLEGYRSVVESMTDEVRRSQRSLSAQLQAIADMKFTYVISCQLYGTQKIRGDPLATDILNLMVTYPSLRVAYIDQVDEREKDKTHRVYYSILVKAYNGLDQVIYLHADLF